MKLCLIVIRVIVSCIVLATACVLLVHAREESVRPTVSQATTVAQEGYHLNPGDPLQLQIARDQKQVLNFELEVGQFAEVIFVWQGIDLNVAPLDLTQKKLLPASVVVSAPGPVSVFVQATEKGVYRLEVLTPVRQKLTGTYTVTLQPLRSPTLTDSNRLAAQALVAEGRTKQSPTEKLEKYKLALVEWKAVQDFAAQASTLMLIGDAYTSKSDLANAKSSYEAAQQAWGMKNDLTGAAYARMRIAAAVRALDSVKNSLSYYDEARQIFVQAGDRRGEAAALYSQAFSHMLLGETVQVVSLLGPAVQIRKQIGDRIGQANGLNMMADAYRKLGDANKAGAAYDEATKAVSGLEYPLLEAALINGRAVVNDDQSDWESAKQDYLNVIKIYESLLGEPGISACSPTPTPTNRDTCKAVATTLINLGEVYNSLGKRDEALAEISKSVQLAAASKDPAVQAEAELHFGYTYFLRGELPTAMDHYRRALTFAEQAKLEQKIALTLVYMGMADVANNKPELALPRYQQALAVLPKTGDKRALAIALDKFAACNQLLGNKVEASNNYAQALDIWKQIKDVDGEALTLYNMAEGERQSGNLSAAVQYSEAAIKRVESLRTRIASEKFRLSYLADKQSYYELDIDLKMQIGRGSADEKSIAAALESSEAARARALLDAVTNSALKQTDAGADAGSKLGALLRHKNTIANQLRIKDEARTTALSAGSKATVTVLDSEINKLIEQLGDVDAEIRVKNPRFAKLTTAKVATTSEIQQQLDSETVMLEFALGEKRSYAWAVNGNKIQGYELPSRKEIEAAATRLLNALLLPSRNDPKETYQQRQRRLDEAENEYRNAATALSRLVLDPLSEQLNHQRMVIVADGALQLIPFSVLPYPKPAIGGAQQSMLDKAEIVMLPSASVLASQRRDSTNRQSALLRVAVIADPVFDSDDERLAELTNPPNTTKRQPNKTTAQFSPAPARPNPSVGSNAKSETTFAGALRDVGLDPNRLGRLFKSRAEAAEIANVVPPKQLSTLMGFDANRDMVTSGTLAGFRYVHFATHGLVDLAYPELSGMVLSRFNNKGQRQDGYLRLYEISDLSLPADLVMLSACQTGTGKQVRGEGLIALTNAFMTAGAATVGATLWNVNDTATAELMKRFYEEIFTNHKRPSAALRAAQLSLANGKRWNAPYFWAGFVLQGEWR